MKWFFMILGILCLGEIIYTKYIIESPSFIPRGDLYILLFMSMGLFSILTKMEENDHR